MTTSRTPELAVEAVDAEAWDALLHAFPEHTVFHRSAWLEALGAARGFRVTRLAAMRGSRCEAVMPCLDRAFGPVHLAGSPIPASATPYLGPLFQPGGDVAESVARFVDHPALRRAAYLACRVLDRRTATDLVPLGFTSTRSFETAWIDLTLDEKELWGNLKSECRTRIRRAEKLRLEVREETSEEFVADFWEMTRETFTRSGARPTHTRALVEQAWRRLAPPGNLLVLSAWANGERASTLVLPYDDHTIYYWAGATRDRYRQLPAGNLLHWHAILEAKRRGLRGYDLISSNGGPGRFKRSFGATSLRTATHWERFSWPLLATAKRLYQRARR